MACQQHAERYYPTNVSDMDIVIVVVVSLPTVRHPCPLHLLVVVGGRGQEGI